MKITMDENGNQINELLERNENIISKLKEKIEKLLSEQELDKKGVKRFGYRALMQIENELMQNPIMTAEKFVRLDYDDIEAYWKYFHSLISYYNMIFEIVPTRQTFQLYMGINSRMYKKLLSGGENSDEDIKDLMIFIEDRLIGNAFHSSTNGNSDIKANTLRLRAKDVGHDVISASEDKLIEKVEAPSEIELMRQLKSVLGGDTKLLK